MVGANMSKRRLFKVVPRGTNLEDEIALTRTRITEYSQMLNEGEQFITVGTDDSGRSKAVLIEDLLERAVAQLNTLTRTQADYNPQRRGGSGVTVVVQVDALPASADVDESLDNDEPKELPAGEQIVDAPVAERSVDKFAELDDDDDARNN